MSSMKKTVLTSVSFAALLTAMGCGDSGQSGPAGTTPVVTGVDALKNGMKDAAKNAGLPTPVVTADGTHVLAFDFNEEDPCAHCIGELTEALGKMPGIKKCDAEKGKRTFTVEFDPKALEAAKLVEAIAKAGDGAKLKMN